VQQSAFGMFSGGFGQFPAVRDGFRVMNCVGCIAVSGMVRGLFCGRHSIRKKQTARSAGRLIR